MYRKYQTYNANPTAKILLVQCKYYDVSATLQLLLRGILLFQHHRSKTPIQTLQLENDNSKIAIQTPQSEHHNSNTTLEILQHQHYNSRISLLITYLCLLSYKNYATNTTLHCTAILEYRYDYRSVTIQTPWYLYHSIKTTGTRQALQYQF